MNKRNRLAVFLTTFTYTILAGLPAATQADDTEIYLGDMSDAVKHNILFILDTSFSMRQDVKQDLNGDGDKNDPGENLGSRISVLQDAMESIIQGLDNVRVGFMRMNGAESPTKPGTALACNAKLLAAGGQTYINKALDSSNTGDNVSGPNWQDACYLPTGGPVLFPISDIDADVSTVAGETSTFDLVVPVSAASDDAFQLRNNTTSTNVSTPVLHLAHNACPAADVVTKTYTISNLSTSDDVEEVSGTITPTSSIDIGTHPTGFRFQNVVIPDNAAILGSTITFTANGGGTQDLNLNITGGVNADSGNTFVSVGGQKVSDRATTTASADWTGVDTVTTGDTFSTPDLSTIIQELVNDSGGWDETGNELIFLVNDDPGNTGRNIHDVTSDSSKAASLEITHCNSVTPVTPADSRNYIGLRFQNVAVPQGAQIESAFLDFVAANPVSNANLGNGVDDDVHIHGELSTTSASFANGVQFNNRALTAHPSISVDWEGDDMGTWVEGNTYTSPDVSSVVDAIVEQSGWCGGRDMTFIIEGDANLLVRAFSAYDDDPARAPVLRIKYSDIYDGNDTGCNRRNLVIPIAQSNHDARTNANTTTVTTTSGGLPMGRPNKDFTIGLIFRIPVHEDASIINARLEFTATSNASSNGTSNLLVNAQDTLDAENFATSNLNLDPATRPRISGTGIPIAWAQGPVADNVTFGVNVEPLVSAVTSQSGWTYDNRMAFFISDDNPVKYRQADSYDGSPSTAPRLLLTVEENIATASQKTVRERLLEINNTFTIPNLLGWTPSVETFYEAARYWRGKGVHYGKQRGSALIDGDGVVENVLIGRSQNPDVYQDMDYKQLMHRTLTSHPGSYTGGTYQDDPNGSDCQFSHDPSCVQDQITGNPVYISPIDTGLECAGNYQIFLTDGAPTRTNQVTEDLIKTEFSDISSCSVALADNAKGSDGRCAVEMAASLRNNDQSTFHTGDQTITTYTIAFNLNDNRGVTWLQQIATAGDGKFYSANSATDLLNAFQEIFNDIVIRPTSFVAPSIAANAFNRLFSRDEVYFGLFEPDQLNRWDGNLKKYAICENSDPDGIANSGDECTLGDVIDITGAPAVGADGLFIGEAGQAGAAQSEWSAAPDGKTIRAGGAGAEITDYTVRTIYTDTNDNGVVANGTTLATDYEYDSTKWNHADFDVIRDDVCPVNSTDTATTDGLECKDRMLFILGKDSFDEDNDGDLADTRWWFHDVLHSSPEIVTYGIDDGADNTVGTADDEFIDKVLVATNDGGLKMINGLTGLEEWSFIPGDLFVKHRSIYDNTSPEHTYGLDSTPLIRVIDNDGDGTIEPGGSDNDKVYVYISQRRGGKNIYALDITPASTLTDNTTEIVPKLLWRIVGGSTGFERMGDTWSEPRFGRIQAGTTGSGQNETPVFEDVLVFGGGYDTDLDDTDADDNYNFGTEAGDPNEGNAIYVVDADTGALIFWVSSDSNADIVVPDMKYAIPSNVTTLDTNGDALLDRVYVGDTAGQVWRLDIADDIDPGGTAPEGSSVVGKLASISAAGTDDDSSGTIDPSEIDDERRFFFPPSVVQVVDTAFSNAAGGEFDYVLIPSGYRAHPLDINVKDRFYAFRDATIDPMVDASPQNGLADDYPLKIDATSNSGNPINNTDLVDVSTSVLTASAKTELGWFFDYNIAAGSPATLTGEKGLAAPAVFAGTLIFTTYIPTQSAPGSCSVSEGSGAAYNFNILTGNANLDWDGDGDIDVDDREYTLGAGIPSEAVPIFTKEGVTVLVGTGGGAENLGKVAGLPRYRTYWYEES